MNPEPFIPAFNWQQHVIAPWNAELPITLWIVLMGFFVTASCGLVGNYLILRRMALVGDAISHSVLAGIAGVIVFTGHLQVTGLFMLDVIFFNALISESSCNPEKDGKNFEISQTDVCALCEHEKASFT